MSVALVQKSVAVVQKVGCTGAKRDYPDLH